MDPMNIFIDSSKKEFRSFIDQICSVPLKAPTKAVSPSYATPIQMLGRLPATSREGFPSLPYLIDSAQRFANLVSLWLDHFSPNSFESETVDQSLRDFHGACLEIQQRTSDATKSIGNELVSARNFGHINDLNLEEEPAHPVTDTNGVPVRTSNPSTATTASSNGLRAQHARNSSSPGNRLPLDRQAAVDPVGDEMASSPSSVALGQMRLPLSRFNVNNVQSSSTTSKSSSTISFHRPLVPRSKPPQSGQETP
jgi:hypothetical protein